MPTNPIFDVGDTPGANPVPNTAQQAQFRKAIGAELAGAIPRPRGLSRLINAKFSNRGSARVRVLLLGDSFAGGFNLSKGYIFQTGRTENPFNFAGGATSDLGSWAYSLDGKCVILPAGASVQYGDNGANAKRVLNARAIYATDPGAGTLTLEVSTDSGSSWATVTSANANAAANVASISDNTNRPVARWRLTASGGTVRILAFEVNESASHGICGWAMSLAGWDWAIQGAGHDYARFQQLCSVYAPDLVVYYMADDPNLTLGRLNAAYGAFKAARPDGEWLVVIPHKIDPAHASFASHETAIANARVWAANLDCPIFDASEVIGDYATANARGLFADQIHLSSVGMHFLTSVFWQSWPWSMFRHGSAIKLGTTNTAGWIEPSPTEAQVTNLEGKLGVRGLSCGVRFYDSNATNIDNALKWMDIYNDADALYFGVPGGWRFKFSLQGVLTPAYSDDTFTIGSSGSRWGYVYARRGNFDTNIVVGGGTAIVKIVSASANLDFPSIAALGEQTLTMTVTGAVFGNVPSVALGWSSALPAGIVVKHAWVSSSNTVSITLANITGSPIDPPAQNVRATVTHF